MGREVKKQTRNPKTEEQTLLVSKLPIDQTLVIAKDDREGGIWNGEVSHRFLSLSCAAQRSPIVK